VSIRIYSTIIDKINWLFVQTGSTPLDATCLQLMNLKGRKLYEQKIGILQPGQMVSFPLDAGTVRRGTYLLELISGSEVIFKKKISVQ